MALAARRVDRLESLASELTNPAGVFAFDAEVPDAPETLLAAVTGEAGMPSILINNAGISEPGAAHRILPETYNRMMAVNLRAPWRLSQLCAASWIEAKMPGVIVNISSILGTRVERGLSVYCMTKAALRHMTAAHAVEWARHGIRVNALCPGYIRTEINDAFWDQRAGQATIARLPRKRVGAPEDLESALLFLCDPRSDFVNGSALTVDDAQGWVL